MEMDEMEVGEDGVPFAYKDPNSRVDFLVNWAPWLGADTITGAATVLSSPDLTLHNQSNTTTGHSIWLTGGVEGKTYLVTSRVTTAGNRQDDRSFRLICRTR